MVLLHIAGHKDDMMKLETERAVPVRDDPARRA